jgi:hypothetical protein
VTYENLDAGPIHATKRVRTYSAVRTARYLYVEFRNGERELYDMVRDPHQLHSLHADPRYARVRSALRPVLRRLRGCRGQRCRAAPVKRIPAPLPR